MNGWGAYLWLELRRTARNPRYLMFTIGFPAAFYYIFAALYGKATLGSGAAALAFAAAYMVAMGAYGAMGAALMSNGAALATERTGGWSRQLRVTPLGPVAYVAAKGAMAVLVALPAVVLVALMGAVLHHVRLDAARWIALVLALWLGSLPFAALGVLLGYAFDSQSAQGGVTIVYFGLSLLGGMWFPYQIMPHGMQLAARILPSYHLVSMGYALMAGHGPGSGNLEVLAAYTSLFVALAVRLYRRDEARTYA